MLKAFSFLRNFAWAKKFVRTILTTKKNKYNPPAANLKSTLTSTLRAFGYVFLHLKKNSMDILGSCHK